MSMRHTVGGAQKVSTPHRRTASSRPAASNRDWFTESTVAWAFHGANTLL